MNPVIMSILAEDDLADILSYVGTNNLLAAQNLSATISRKFNLLSGFPEMGRRREDVARRVRQLTIKPWLALYRIERSCILVVRIVHMARNLKTLDMTGVRRP